VFPVTHRSIISAITPNAIPATATQQLNVNMLKMLQTPYDVFQLDATAYPGNSGSPLYDENTGKVVGIINKVFVQGSKENALTNPSGISYAIPAEHIKKLLLEKGAK
jgi:S1-C subfamily serine protease